MSRRESRVSMHARQNDALFEFESFKKKFLLANKHITKLNSTLSVRIEELNAQISTLYVENLRLRASEIALSAQLKKEREKSRKIIADAEAATANLSKHLGFLRHSYNIDATSPPSSPPPPRARRPVINPTISPQVPRLSRPPDFPGISEHDEGLSSENDHEPCLPELSSSPRRKTKPKARLSASRLPLPSRVSSPPLHPSSSARAALQVDVEAPRPNVGKRKPSRRQSGLLAWGGLDTDGNEIPEKLFLPRIPSPAFGSPIQRSVHLDDDDDDEIGVVDPDVETNLKVDAAANGNEEHDLVARKEKRKGKNKESERERERDAGVEVAQVRENRRTREDVEYDNVIGEGIKSKLKDVTNSPRSRLDLPTPDANTADCDRHQTSEPDSPGSTLPTSTSSSNTRTVISTPATATGSLSQLLTPRSSSSPVQLTASETEVALTNGRERRTRKSVNYAEPKLNTKMRKPDPPPGTTSTTRKRSSVSAATHVLALQSDGDVDEPAPRSSFERESIPKAVNGRPSSPHLTLSSLHSITISSKHSSVSRPSAATTIKRNKHRPHLLPDDDDSDGAQADVDVEYAGGKGNAWVNIDGRRRSHLHSSKKVNGIDSNGKRRVDEEDGRRHSMAV